MTIIANAKIVIANLYWERIIKKGKTLKKLAKLAPAPSKINTAGRAQHIRVDEDAKRLKSLQFYRSFLKPRAISYCAVNI